MELGQDLVVRALTGRYPVRSETSGGITEFGPNKLFNSPREVVEAIEPLVSELEARLEAFYDANTR